MSERCDEDESAAFYARRSGCSKSILTPDQYKRVVIHEGRVAERCKREAAEARRAKRGSWSEFERR